MKRAKSQNKKLDIQMREDSVFCFLLSLCEENVMTLKGPIRSFVVDVVFIVVPDVVFGMRMESNSNATKNVQKEPKNYKRNKTCSNMK